MEVVFSTPDVAEAERTRAFLAKRGLKTDMAYGPDPVTGLGGNLFGGLGAQIYNVSVDDADTAREALANRESHDEVPEEKPFETPPSSWSAPLRRMGRPFFALFFLLSVIVFVLFAAFMDDWLLIVPTAIVLGVLLFARR